MTYRDLKTLTSALLAGDTNVPTNEKFLQLVKYGFSKIADEADALKLLTVKDSNERIVRNGPGNTYVRMPKEPENEEDELDIDDELAYALAEYIASFISNSSKVSLHIQNAQEIIRRYNQKVQAYFEELEAKGELTGSETIYGVRRYD
jgi:hypothetical protein